MSLRSLEAAILRELRQQPGLSKVRQKDIQEWGTHQIELREGERIFFCPQLAVYVAVRADVVKK